MAGSGFRFGIKGQNLANPCPDCFKHCAIPIIRVLNSNGLARRARSVDSSHVMDMPNFGWPAGDLRGKTWQTPCPYCFKHCAIPIIRVLNSNGLARRARSVDSSHVMDMPNFGWPAGDLRGKTWPPHAVIVSDMSQIKSLSLCIPVLWPRRPNQ